VLAVVMAVLVVLVVLMPVLPVAVLVVPVVLIGALAVVPLTGEFPALVGSLAVIFSLVALSFVILTGWTGDVSLGQVVPYGLGAYGTFVFSDRLGLPVALAVVAAALATVPLLVLIGTPALRLRGLDLAIATFALALVFQVLAFPAISRSLAGGGSGVTDFSSAAVQVARPTVLHTNRSFYVAALLAGVLVVAAVAALGRSSFGLRLRAVRDDPVRAAAIGIGVGRHRLAAFVLSGVIAAFAGGMVGSLRQAITPATFNIFESLNFLAFAVIGGVTSPLGAILGGVVGAGLPELARVDPFRFLQGHLVLVYGAALVVLLALRPDGLAGALGWNRRSPAPLPEPAPPVPRLVGDDGDRSAPALLEVDEIVVRYGGVRAVDAVSFEVREGEAVALIGPNGAGKSSLFDALSGFVRPSAGAVRFQGRDVTRLRPERRAGGGLGRTFQMAHTFPDLTVAENLLTAAEAGRVAGGSPATVHWLLRRLGLAGQADTRPAELPFGALRRLEVGLALAAQPRLLLLDEPTAGMGAADADALCDLLDDLRAELGLAVLLVEHDMAVVGRLAERVLVLDQGGLLAQGSPAEIAADPAVVAAYLGSTAGVLENVRIGGDRARSS